MIRFSVYRQCGYNRNSTVRSFKAAFQINTVHNLMRPQKNASDGLSCDNDKNILNILNVHDPLTMLNKCERSQNNSRVEYYQHSLNVVLGNSSNSVS